MDVVFKIKPSLGTVQRDDECACCMYDAIEDCFDDFGHTTGEILKSALTCAIPDYKFTYRQRWNDYYGIDVFHFTATKI